MNSDGYDLLVEAIIAKSVKDYEWSLKYKDIEPTNEYEGKKKRKAEYLYADTVNFFHSDWYRKLFPADGDELIKRVNKHYCEYTCTILADDETRKKSKRKIPLTLDQV